MAQQAPPAHQLKDPGEVGARRGTRVAIAALVVLAVAFALSSAWQLARGVFFDGEKGSEVARALDGKGECARALRRLGAGVEHALVVSATAATEETAVAAFEGALRPALEGTPSAADVCEKEPGGTDAYAALERLRRAAEGVARHRAGDMAGARRDVAGLLGP
jgi:hypothetical protein